MHSLFFDVSNQFNLNIVIVTHDKELSALSDRIITMKDGLVHDS